MGMRITTGMTMNSYRYNLQMSTLRLNKSSTMVQTQRKFNSFAEDPAAATQAWRIRRAIVNNGVYQSNNSDTYTRFNIAWATLAQASHDLTDLDGRSSDIYAANDPTAAGRNALGTVLRQTAQSVIQTMNGGKAGENFVFAGDDELYAPFTWGTDMWGNETLFYRGVDVNSGGVSKPTEDPVPDRWGEIDKTTGLPANMPYDTTNAVDKAWYNYYVDQAYQKYDAAVDTYDQDLADYNQKLAAYNQYLQEKEDYDAGLTDVEPEEVPPPGDPPVEPKAPPVGRPAGDVLNPDDWKDDPFAADIAAGKVDDYGVPLAAFDILHGDKEDVSPEEIIWAEYYLDRGNYTKLERMSKEVVAIDLGMGMLEDDNGKLVDGTYYNRALPGINMLGYGIDEDGDPKNVCMIMMRLAEIYEACDPDTGAYKNEAEKKEAIRLIDKLKAGQALVSEQYVEVSAKSSYLLQNESTLKLEGDYLNEELVQIEDVDEADAINQFMWDYYCYSAALKIGTQLLSQSLIDYMS